MTIPTPIKVRKTQTIMAVNDEDFQIWAGSIGSLANFDSQTTKRTKWNTETISKAYK